MTSAPWSTRWRVSQGTETPWANSRTRRPRKGETWEPGAPREAPDLWSGASRGAPGSHVSPLRGLRVLEFAQGVSVPWLTRHLVDHGAEVIRVETLTHPDSSRLYVSPRAAD